MALLRSTAIAIRERAPALIARPNGSPPLSWRERLPGGRTSSGKWVDIDTALTVSAVYRAIRIRAGAAAQLPLHVYQRNADGTRREIREPQDAFIWGRPNREANRFVFWDTVFTHYVTNGNAYLYVVAAEDTSTRRPAELYPIEPGRVAPGRAPNGEKVYLIDGLTPAKDWINGGEIVHVQGPGTDGLRGLSLIRLGAAGIGLALAAEEFAARFFGSGSLPGGVLATEQVLTDVQAKAISEGWEASHGGTQNANRVAVLGRGIKWMHTSLNAGDAQLLESRQFQVSEVARWFGIPEVLLNAHDKTTSWGTGIAELNRGLLTYTIDPDLVNVEQTITDELLRQPNRYVKFSREGMLRGDNLQRAQYNSILRQNGILSADEWRALEDMPPLPDGQGKIYLNPLNMADAGGAKAPMPEIKAPRAMAGPIELNITGPDVNMPAAPRTVRKTIERDGEGNIMGVIEEVIA